MKVKDPILAFDLGGVLFDFDYKVTFSKLKCLTSVGYQEMSSTLIDEGLSLKLEQGRITFHEFYTAFKNRFNLTNNFNDFTNAWCDIFTPKHDVIDIVKKLSSNYHLYLISNICQPHYDFLSLHYPYVFNLFDQLVLSYRLGAVKPEDKIFNHLSALAKTDLRKIIYIDDRNDLTEPARRMGIKAITFTDAKQLSQSLSLNKIEF